MFVVNLYGGPGTGKSSTAAGVFSKLKWRGHNCELVTEYAKDVVWEQSFKKLENQIYVFGKQLHRLWRLKGQVDIAITDSPILLSLVYDQSGNDNFKNLVLDEYNSFNNLNIFLVREKPYLKVGRTQTADEAKELDINIKDTLFNNKCDYNILNANEGNMDTIVTIIEETLNHEKSKN